MEQRHPLKTNSRKEQAKRSKQRLVDTAQRLLDEKGYNNTSVQDICKGAGLSIGVFYHYFASKQAILQEVIVRKNQDLLQYIDHSGASATHTEALLDLFGYICRQQTEHSFDTVCGSFTLNPDKLVTPDRWLPQLISGIVESAQQAGEMTCEISPDQIADDLLISATGYVYHWCEAGGTYDVFEGQQAYLRRLLRAYLP